MISKKLKDIVETFQYERYEDIKNEFSPEVDELFSIDKYAQVGLLNYSMSNFYPLIQDLIDELVPKTICEIGVDTGFNTYLLNDICESYQGRLHSVDPIINKNNANVISENVTYYTEKSEEYLKRKIYNRVYFIDGEHTYDALYHELESIHCINNELGKHSVIFVHDMSWPHSYRDVIYDEESYRHKERARGRGHIFPSSSSFCEYGMPIKYADVTAYEGGEENGLLKAVQDFLSSHNDYDFCKVPSQYGFGIIWNKNDVVNVTSLLEVKKEKFENLKSFLGLLELNRFLLISKIEHLHGILDDFSDKLTGSSDQIVKYKEDISLLESSIRKYREDTSLLESSIRKYREDTSLLESNIKKYEIELKELSDNLNTVNEKYAAIERENNRIKNSKIFKFINVFNIWRKK